MSIMKQRCRSGGYTIEFALVLPIMLLLIFGILEFCRYIYIMNLVEHAAREGARYAVVNTQDKATSDVENLVKERLHGFSLQIDSLVVAKVDPATLQFLDDKDQVVATPGLAPFNDAKFGQGIMVKIEADLTLMFLGWTMPVQSTAVMYSEAN